ELYDAAYFDRIYVLNHGLEPLYAMHGGGRTGAERFDADRAAVTPLVERLKAIGAAGAAAAFRPGHPDDVPHVAEPAIIDGRPAYVGVSAIMSESGDDELKQKPGSESFLVAVRFLEGSLGSQFAEKFFIEAPRFTAEAPADEARARLPL